MRRALALSTLVLLGLAGPASARLELAPGVVVLEPMDVLAAHVVTRGGSEWVDIPGHEPWELVAERDPATEPLAPLDASDAADAWRSVASPFRDRLGVTIVILPRPRRALPNSSAEDHLVYLSPGPRSFSRAQVHFLLAHELGHVVHRALMPDGDESWERYRALRGIEDRRTYHDWADHADRPREIFAEDFRYLFGGELANYSGGIENTKIPLPDAVPGLAGFFLGLLGETSENDDPRGWDIASSRPLEPWVRVSPQPSRGASRVTVGWPDGHTPEGARLAIYDASGRRIAELANGQNTGAALRFVWDGTTAAGRSAPAGVFYAMVEGTPVTRTPEAGGRILLLR